MDVLSILAVIFGGGGLIGGGISIYNAKAKKNSLEIENFKKLFDEAQEERENIRQQHQDYMKQTDEKIDRLEKRIDYSDKRNAIKMRAINSAYRCTLPKDTKECPVLRTLNKESDNDVCESSGVKDK